MEEVLKGNGLDVAEEARLAARELAEAAARANGVSRRLDAEVLAVIMEEGCARHSEVARRLGVTTDEVRKSVKRLRRRGLVRPTELRGLWCATAEAYLTGLARLRAEGRLDGPRDSR